MKDIIAMLDRFAEAAEGQNVLITLQNKPFNTVRELAKEFGKEMSEPTTSDPRYTVVITHKGIQAVVSTEDLKVKKVIFETL